MGNRKSFHRIYRCGTGNIQFHLLAYHHLCERIFSGLAGIYGTYVLSFSQNGNAVGNLQNLVKLMGNNDNGFIICLHISDNLKQTGCLLRCQYCCRLIQDQNVCTSVKNLYNFQSLFLGYAHLVNLLIQVQIKVVPVTDSLCFFTNLFQIKFLFFIKTKRNILSGTEYVDQFKVLVNHTDSQIVGIFWRADFHFPAVYHDLAGIWKINTGDHIHKSGLATSIFSQKGENLTFFYVKVDIFVGNNFSKCFGNIF